MSESKFELAVVGAGPGGLSAAARATEQGMSHVLLESAEKHANTVQQYQHHEHVMAEPSVLPLRSDVAFSAGRSEEILEGPAACDRDEPDQYPLSLGGSGGSARDGSSGVRSSHSPTASVARPATAAPSTGLQPTPPSARATGRTFPVECFRPLT